MFWTNTNTTAAAAAATVGDLSCVHQSALCTWRASPGTLLRPCECESVNSLPSATFQNGFYANSRSRLAVGQGQGAGGMGGAYRAHVSHALAARKHTYYGVVETRARARCSWGAAAPVGT